MSPLELAAAVETAHAYGVSVAAHAERSVGIKNAIRAGVDTVQHGTFLDDEALGDLLEQHPDSRLVFTTGVYDGIITIGPRIGYPNAARQRFVDAWPEIVANVRKAYDRGIPFAGRFRLRRAVAPARSLCAQRDAVRARVRLLSSMPSGR